MGLLLVLLFKLFKLFKLLLLLLLFSWSCSCCWRSKDSITTSIESLKEEWNFNVSIICFLFVNPKFSRIAISSINSNSDFSLAAGFCSCFGCCCGCCCCFCSFTGEVCFFFELNKDSKKDFFRWIWWWFWFCICLFIDFLLLCLFFRFIDFLFLFGFDFLLVDIWRLIERN